MAEYCHGQDKSGLCDRVGTGHRCAAQAAAVQGEPRRKEPTQRRAQRQPWAHRAGDGEGPGKCRIATVRLAALVHRAAVFDVVSASSAGSLARLLWLAPKGQTSA
jgi:hypothetical protein